jgi:hypothetical protein
MMIARPTEWQKRFGSSGFSVGQRWFGRAPGIRVPLLYSYGFAIVAYELTENEHDGVRIAR